MYITTPFDELLSDMSDRITHAQLRGKNSPLTDIGKIAGQHLPFLRAIYLTFPITESNALYRKTEFDNLTPIQKHASLHDRGNQTKHAYFSFVNALNLFGRRFKEVDFTLPLKYRINFFRNKVIEHWDEYIALPPGGASMGKFDRITVPIVFGEHINTLNSDASLTRLVSAFNLHHVTLNITKFEYYDFYADKIWPALEKIGTFEHKCHCKKELCPYKDIVDSLFAYEFPLPFYDVEFYSEQLVGSLRTRVFINE